MATTYGVTSTGFVIQRMADTQALIQQALQGGLGAGVNLDPRSPLGQIVGIMAERFSEIWEAAQGVYNAFNPNTAEGINLDNAVGLTGITRKPATYSTAVATAYGTAGTVIPSGSVVSVAGNAPARFATTADATIAAAINEVQTLTFSAVPTGGSFAITYNGVNTALINSAATTATVQTALTAINGLSGVTVSGSYAAGFVITFGGSAGGIDQPPLAIASNTLTATAVAVTVAVIMNTQGTPAQAALGLTAQTAGSIAAPAGSLTTIETPVAGWASVSNATDATVGFNIESDADLKTRRAASIQKSGAGTPEAIRADLLALPTVTAVLIFENSTWATDSSGRPPKSFEVLVQGGDDATIATTIWQDKPAGIATYGQVAYSLLDSQGFSQTIYYTRPTAVAIWIELDVTRSPKFPINGATLLQNAILEYGATLGLGDDVIVIPALVAFLNEVAGITNIVIRIGTAVHPTTSANVPIAVTQIAQFDTSRITVNLV